MMKLTQSSTRQNETENKFENLWAFTTPRQKESAPAAFT
jgi:subtilase family serine protease